MEKYVFVLLAALGGLCMGFQPPVNSALSKFTGIIESSCISFTVGALALFILSLIFGKGSLLNFMEAPKFLLIGGLLGATVVTVTIFAIPKIGSLAMVTAVIFGQMLAALFIDKIGFLGLPAHPITWTRILGITLMLAGLRFVLVK